VANLDNMRKRAKSLVRQHRNGSFPVASRLRVAVPAFAGLRDRDILDTPFSLAEAQHVVAREVGFDNWAHAVEELSLMSSQETIARTNVDAPVLHGAYPQIFVTDVTSSCDFYAGVLGFAVAYRFGEPPFYAMVVRGQARLNLRHVDQPAIDPQQREADQLLSANIPVDGVKDLFLEFKERGVDVFQSLRDQPWGATDFIVRDPDGNLICFASRPEDRTRKASQPVTD